jgi:NADPH-dependent ferric siderophore reductase
MKLIQSIIEKTLHSAVVVSKEKITTATYHLTLKLNSDSFGHYIPGQHLRIVTGTGKLSALGDLVRTYSVWHYDSNRQEIQLAICNFSNGSGAKWIQNLQAGDLVYFKGPEGKLTINPETRNHIFLGDTSSLAHLYELSRNTGPDNRSYGIVYSASKEHIFEDVSHNNRFGFLTSPIDAINEIISEIAWNSPSADNTTVYIAGEAAFCIALHGYFKKALQFPARQIKTKPFWQPGKKGLE